MLTDTELDTMFQKEDALLLSNTNTLKKAIKNINEWDDVAFAKMSGILLPNGFTNMPPFSADGMEMYIDSDSDQN